MVKCQQKACCFCQGPIPLLKAGVEVSVWWFLFVGCSLADWHKPVITSLRGLTHWESSLHVRSTRSATWIYEHILSNMNRRYRNELSFCLWTLLLSRQSGHTDDLSSVLPWGPLDLMNYLQTTCWKSYFANYLVYKFIFIWQIVIFLKDKCSIL